MFIVKGAKMTKTKVFHKDLVKVTLVGTVHTPPVPGSEVFVHTSKGDAIIKVIDVDYDVDGSYTVSTTGNVYMSLFYSKKGRLN